MNSRTPGPDVAPARARTAVRARAGELAEAAWGEARYDDAIAFADGSDPRASIFAAHAHLRRRRPCDALAVLPTGRVADASLRGRIDVLAALARHMIDHGQSASPPTFDFPAAAVADAETAGLACLFSATSAWLAGRLDEAETYLRKISSANGPWVEALESELHAWLDVRHGRFATASQRFLRALDLIAVAPRGDERMRINAIFGLSSIAYETLDLSLLPRLKDECERLPASPELNHWACLALTGVAVACELAGDDVAAVSYLLRAQAIDVAPTVSAWTVIELAAFHRRAGEDRSARIHVERARRLIETIDWTQADIEARVLLLRWAVELAGIDYAGAARALTQALSYEGKRDPWLVFEHDDRARAFATYTSGILALRRGDLAAASTDLTLAAEFWSGIGYRLRAAEAEAELADRLTVALPAPNLDIARAAAPDSRFARMVVKPKPVRSMPKLGPAEQRVLDQICIGYTSKQIAAELGRSASTIRNQTIRIFRTFEVNDRHALIAKVAALRANESA